MPCLLLIITLVLFSAQSGRAQTISRENCSSAITMYCTMCHSTARICKGLKTFDAEGWTRVLKRMGKESDDVDQGVQNMVHACLATMKPGDFVVCRDDG
jgi:hypothetical protein